jgi:hypothetical protein
VWSGCAGTVKQKREAGTNASLQICSQQSLQDRADHNYSIIEEFRKTVKAKLEERNISSFPNFVQMIVVFADLCYNTSDNKPCCGAIWGCGHWYYGHGHVYGCEFGGNRGDGYD